MSLAAFYEGWRDLMDNKSDPRTNDWLLMSSPFPTIAISLTYAYCVKVRICKRNQKHLPFHHIYYVLKCGYSRVSTPASEVLITCQQTIYDRNLRE